jgi:hypothetical protein
MRTEGDGGSDRTNLPDQVEPGRTYRGAEVTGWLEDSVSIAGGDQELSDGSRGSRRQT